jgi:hypothetical protein
LKLVLVTNNNLALSFNNDKTWGRVSMAYMSKTGIVPNTEYKRKNVGLRLGTDITDKLKLDISANYVNSGSDNLPVLGGGGESVINNMHWGMNNYDYNDYKDNCGCPDGEALRKTISFHGAPSMAYRKRKPQCL